MKSSLAFFKQHVLPALVCFALAYAVGQTEWVQRVANLTLDSRTKFRAHFFPTKPRDDVAVVGIDQESLNQLGRWPWDRNVHGDFLQLVGRMKPSVVAWDILFDDPSEHDAHFADGIRKGGADVVLGGQGVEADLGIPPDDASVKNFKLAPLTRIEGDATKIVTYPAMSVPHSPLGEVADIGFVDTPPGPDGFRRDAPLVVRIGSRVYPTLALRSLMHHWHLTPDQVTVRLGDAVVLESEFIKRRIPIDATGAFFINYRHALDGFLNFGYGETFAALYQRIVQKKTVDVPEFTGRILLVGQTADGLSDFGPTPFSALTPLVLVHANVLENVLNEDYATRAPPVPIWLGGCAITVASLAFFSKRKFSGQVLFSLGLPLVYGMISALFWAKFSIRVPIVWPVLGFVAAQIYSGGRRVLSEQRAKEQIKGMFGTYISPELVDRMVASGVSPQLGGHEEEITAYFSDIQGYSTFSEKLPPAQLVELLNDYLTACTDIVQEEGGTLDKYIGDAVVAMFGAPIALPDHAYRACVTALRVQQKLDELRAKWEREGERWPEGVRRMRSRIGLNTGAAVIGNMGSRTRFNYTMTGDNVNLAARMESGAKQWGVYTMITEATKLACERHGGDRIVFRSLGRMVVKGRTQPLPLFEPVGFKEIIAPQTRQCIEFFEQGLASYYARDWDAALAWFGKSHVFEPNAPGRIPGVVSNPSKIYLGIVAGLKQSPPAAEWDGVFVMSEK